MKNRVRVSAACTSSMLTFLATVAPAQAQTTPPDLSAPSPPATSLPSQSEASDAQPGQDIVVTGSLIRQSVVPSPTDVITADIISSRNVTNPSELVRAITANAGSEAQVDQLNQPLTSGTAQFNLRNLGLDSTLVLLNGRRQTLAAVASGDGSTFTDINSLVPLIAVQRVEVVKDGGAATYGSDAVGGVVNFITRRKVDRPEISARINFINGAKQVDAEAITGFKVFGGDLVLAGSFYSSTRLGTDERSFSQARTFGLPSWHSVSSYGQPGSYYRPSLKKYVPDPSCDNPIFTDSYRTSAADTFCRFDFSKFFDLIPKERRVLTYASYNGSLGGGVNVNLEAAYANTYSQDAASPSFPILQITPVVPASNPNNPFGENVLFRGRLLGEEYGPSIATFKYDTFRVAGGLDGKIAGTWGWSANTSYSQQNVIYNKPDTIASALTNALNGLGGPGCNPATGTPGVGACQYFNPFGSARLGTGSANSQALINSLIGYTDLHGRASLFTLEGVATGNLFTYSGGTVAAAIGTQFRRDTFSHNWGALVNAGELISLGKAPDFAGSQEVYSVFGELKVPFQDIVELQLSGRYEKYKNSFDNFSPKASILVRPFKELALRASYGRAFRAPSTYQLTATQVSQPSVNDAGTFAFINAITVGNPNLRPERSSNYNLGATFKPIRRAELSVDYYSFNYKDLIVKENPQPFVDQARADTAAGLTNTPAQQRLTRDSTGALQSVRLNFINASSVKTSGIDVSGRIGIPTGIGEFTLSGSWTHVIDYTILIAPGAAPIQGAGNVNFNNLGRSLPRDRVENSVTWTSGGSQFVVLGHYVSGYTNDRSGITDASISPCYTVDLQYNLTLARFLGGSTFTVGAINIADRDPPIAQLNLGFDPIVADPRGRVIYVGIKQRF